MRKVLITTLAVIIAATTITLFACGKKVNELKIVEQLMEDGETDIMLMDYFRQVVGTETYQGYYEIVLYAIPDENGKLSQEEVRMDVYTDGGLRTEKVASKNVSYEAYTRAMELIKEKKVYKWADLDDTISIDGCSYVCKFPYGDKYERVSAEEMPEDGMEFFDAILSILEEYK